MRGVGMQFALALACAAALVGCGGDDDDDDDGAAGSGPVSASGKGGGGEAGSSAGAGGASGASGYDFNALPPGATKCNADAAANCPEAVNQTDGVPCCTVMADIITYGTARGNDTCGLFFTGRIPCFELHAPGAKDDECPQNLDQGWGHHDGCCHPFSKLCGIINEDTGCTLFRDTAKKLDGSAIGMASSLFPCTPD